MKNSNLTSLTDLPIPGLIQPGILQANKTGNLSHAPLTGPQAYYRSKLISTTNGINPLIAAASALFAFITQLQTATTYFASKEIYQDLLHEIKAFESQAHTQGYRSEIILLGRYVLCATLDEMILTSHWGMESQWHKHKLLATFHGEDWGGERFFLILERLSADPAIYIDLLELMYICLSLGYAGKYRLADAEQSELNTIAENLYQCIHWQRGDVHKELAIAEPPAPSPIAITTSVASMTSTTTQPLLSCILIAVSTLILLAIMYVGFNFMLNSSAIPIEQQLNTLLQNYANQ